MKATRANRRSLLQRFRLLLPVFAVLIAMPALPAAGVTGLAAAGSNLVGNPGFEIDTSGWNTASTSVTLARVSGGHSGGWSAQVSNAGTVATTCTLNDSPNWVAATAAGTYTASVWVRADAPGAQLKLRLREYQNTTLSGSVSSTVTLGTSWQQASVAYTPAHPGSSSLDFQAYVSAAGPGSCFFADDAAITLAASVPDVAPAVSLVMRPASGTAPMDVTADATGSSDTDGTPIASYRFDFGDGSAAVGPQAAAAAGHTYSTAGSYLTTVTVTDTAGLSAIATAPVTVTAPDAAPNAAITLTPASGATPLTVTASAAASTDTDATPIATYTFDFGDASAKVGPQASATAVHTYSGGSAYRVTVVVTDTAGLSSSAAASVTANGGDAPPIAALRAAPGSGAVPFSTTLDASGATDTDATPIATYTFDFGDGSPPLMGAGATATHIYAAAGSYRPTVVVTDTAGLSSSAAATVNATVPSLRIAVIGDYGICAYGPCKDERGVASLVHGWNPDLIMTVGDNSYLSGLYSEVAPDQQPYAADVAARRFYPIAGNHDWDSGSYSASQSYFGLPSHYVAHLGSGLIDLFALDMNSNPDGTSASSVQATRYRADLAASTAIWKLAADHEPFYSSGLHGSSVYTHWAILPAIDLFLSGHDHDMEQLLVGGQPYIVDGAGGNELYPTCQNGCLPGSVWHQGSNFGAVRMTVTPTTLTAEFVVITPTVPTGVLVHRLTIAKSPPPSIPTTPLAAMSVTPAAATAPLAVAVDASRSAAQGGATIASYQMSFGDGSPVVTQAGPSVSHRYAAPGTYTITVSATDSAGRSSTASAPVVVSVPETAPATALSVNRQPGVALGVTADASASTDGDGTGISSYVFTFGDGAVFGPQASPVVSHAYAAAGTYTVGVTATDSVGLATTTTTAIAVDDPPAARVTVAPGSGTTPLLVTADASSSTDGDGTPISTYQFDFGDGTVIGPQAGATSTHSYTTGGSYTVTVKVTDTAGNVATATGSVQADAPPAAALALTSAAVPPLSVSADASASSDNDASPIATYRFDFGDGTIVGPQSGATAGHTYAAPGTYPVTVTVADTAGLTASASASVTLVQPDLAPAAALSVTPASVPSQLPVVADASGSTDTDATPIANYRFDFGDGTVIGPQTAATASHTYAAAGTFTVVVTVSDTAGNASTVSSRVIVLANLVGNPGFETDTGGWNTGGVAGVTLARSSQAHSGNSSAQLTNTGTAAVSCILNDSPNWAKTSAAGTYTATIWVRADAAGAVLRLKIREYGPTGLLLGFAASSVTLSTAWQPIQVQYTPTSPGASTLDLQAYLSSLAPPGTGFYADDVAMTRG